MGENKYEKGKIYMITDVAYNERYYGSTIEPLNKRMIHHKHRYVNQNSGKETCLRSANALFNKYGYENCKIELVENYPCSSKEELRKREGLHIRKNQCVNKYIAGRTQDEYNEENREQKNAKKMEWYYREKNNILEKINCPCGSVFSKNGKSEHLKTIRHQEWLKQQEPEKEPELQQLD